MFAFLPRSCAVQGRRQAWGGRGLAFEALEPRNLLSTYYVDPAGLGGPPQDANPGTIGSPMATLNAAVKRAQAGDTIILRAATYNIADINRSRSDARRCPGTPLTIEAAPGEHPILDLAEWYHWQQDPNGYWYVDLPANSVAVHGSNATVEIRNGWAASTIVGDSVDGGPPAAFTQPDSVYYQNGQLAFDLTWYDQANHRLWFRSNEIQPITNPDCAMRHHLVQESVRQPRRILAGFRWVTDLKTDISASTSIQRRPRRGRELPGDQHVKPGNPGMRLVQRDQQQLRRRHSRPVVDDEDRLRLAQP